MTIFIKPDIYNSQSEIDIKVVSRYDSNKSVLISHSIYDYMGDLIDVFDSIYKLDPGKNLISETIDFEKNFFVVSESPKLYKLKSKIVHKESINDQVSETFGFREFTIKNDKFYLNDKPLYLKAAFFEGLYPVKLSIPDSKEMIIKEIQLAKEAGI